MARRRYMHGKRRRRSSYKLSPLKHTTRNGRTLREHAHDEDGNHPGDQERAKKFREARRQGEEEAAKNEPEVSAADADYAKRQAELDKQPGVDKKQVEEKDSLGENIVEIFDPTGVSSWDDAARAYNKEEWGLNEYLDMASVIPFAGKLTKLFKGAKTGINLAKKGFSTTQAAQNALEVMEGASDIYQDNIQGGVGGGGGKTKSKTRSPGWAYYGGVK